jgi:hypothetical protein
VSAIDPQPPFATSPTDDRGDQEADIRRARASAQALRDLIDEVRLISENGRLEIELLGDVAGIPGAEHRR